MGQGHYAAHPERQKKGASPVRSPMQEMSRLIPEGRSAASGAGGRRGGREDAHSSQRFTSGLCSSVF